MNNKGYRKIKQYKLSMGSMLDEPLFSFLSKELRLKVQRVAVSKGDFRPKVSNITMLYDKL